MLCRAGIQLFTTVQYKDVDVIALVNLLTAMLEYITVQHFNAIVK